MVETIFMSIVSFAWIVVAKTAFVWGPVLAMYLAFKFWQDFVTDRFISGITWTLLEIEIPRNIEKTPMAMELILTNAMYHASGKGIWETWVQGAPHFWFSLEIVGIDGGVHFYIRTPSRIRDLIETQIYAQYPQAKVKEAEDYTLKVSYDAPNKDWYIWGTEFKLENPDAYPIKTYKDFGLDKPSDKEQQKIDPITPIIEFLGSLRRGQQVWLQYIIRPSKLEYKTKNGGEVQGWVKGSYDEMEKILVPFKQEMFLSNTSQNAKKGDDVGYQIRPPEYVLTKVKKMQEKMQKIGFDIGIRAVALSESKYVPFNEFENLRRSFRLLFRQFNNPDLNSIVRYNPTGYDSPWADPTGIATWKLKNRMLNWYRLRTFFHPPFWYSLKLPSFLNLLIPFKHDLTINVMNVEEIATIYHFPGQVSQTPSFQRVESKVAKPPPNLPI
jgi:hypothetical protein